MRSKCVVKVMLFVIIPVFMAIVPAAVYSQQGQEEATAEITMQSENDSLATAKNDSAAVAQDLADMAERESLGPILYNLKNSGIGEKYVKGGNFMHALLLASIVLFVFIIERFVTLFRARVNVRKLMNNVIKSMRSEGVEGAMRVCEGTKGPIAAVLHSGLLRSDRGPDAVKEAIETSGSIETSFLERGLVVIATVAQVAPLLGFLGTVSGMISAFASIAAAEQVSAKVVASGIEEALITTATGLIIAIPASIGHSYFVSQIDRFVLEMEEASAELVNELIESGRIEN
ncbi:MAG: MotA/TolQ/ExbB proton channel family protein [Candidatus Krumholzibacteriota bacterium]|nr:MotA/TolQ/ExbB proton channel family protein [Candidatus Krumholzibacteriota bacterium]